VKAKPRTTRVSARPGGTIHHFQAPVSRALFELALDSMIPQLAWLGSPRPRKARAASEMMAALATRTNWADVTGVSRVRMWRTTQRVPVAPMARAACTWGYSRSFSTCAHSTRAGRAHVTAPITTAVTISPRPKNAASTSTRGRKGKARVTSVRRISTVSAHPLRQPATRATVSPTTTASTAAPSPMASEMREP
jgi:hypothetical protein